MKQAGTPPRGGPAPRPRSLLFALCFAGVCAGAVQSVVVPVLPDIAEQLGVSAAAVSWAVTAGLVSAAVVVPVFGRLADLRGGRTVLLWCLALLIAGGVVSALAPSLPLLLLGRALQGTGGAVFPLTITVLRREADGNRLTSAMALVSATLGMGGGLGPVVAGLLNRICPDYRAVFWLTAVVGITAMLFVALLVPRRGDARTAGRVDAVGAGLLGVGLVLLILPLSQAPGWGRQAPWTGGMLAVSAAVLWLFVRVQRSRPHPLVAIDLLRRRPVLVSNLLAVLVGAVMYIQLLGISQLVRSSPEAAGYGFGASPLTTAVVYLLPVTVAAMLAGPVGGRLVIRFGGRATIVAGGVIGTGGFAALTVAHERPYQVIAAGMAVGVMVSLAYAAMPALLTRFVPAGQTGMANSVNTLTRWIGGAAASSFVAAVLAACTPAGGRPRETAIAVIFGSGVLISVTVAILAGIGLPRRAAVQPEPQRSAVVR